MARTRIAEFGIIQKGLAFGTVAIYLTDTNGESTGVLAPLYQAATGSEERANPQMLDENGKLANDCWVEGTVMAEIRDISETTERSLKKIRMNPMQYPLPITSAGAFAAASAAAVAAAATATAAATTASTQATNAATQAATATAQAATATTQATNAAASAAQALAAQVGMKRKVPVRAATTGALPSSNYSNGASGVGATITAAANGAWSSANSDGVSIGLNDGLLVKNEGTALRNGLYILTQVGSAGTPWILTRQTDSDTWAEIAAAVVTVMEGANHADQDFLCTSNLTGGTMGTTAVTWQAYNQVIADGAVSTAAKVANGILTYAKMAAAAFATTALELYNGTANLIVNAATLKLFSEAYLPRKVYSASIAAAANHDITGIFRAGYNYQIKITGMRIGSNGQPFMRISTDNGATYKAGASDYSYSGLRGSTSIVGYSNTAIDAHYLAGDTLTNTTDIDVLINIFNPAVAGKRKFFHSMLSNVSTGTQVYTTNAQGAYVTDTNAINAIRFATSSGSFLAAGTITVYEEAA